MRFSLLQFGFRALKATARAGWRMLPSGALRPCNHFTCFGDP
jgi:hypothetical protein